MPYQEKINLQEIKFHTKSVQKQFLRVGIICQIYTTLQLFLFSIHFHNINVIFPSRCPFMSGHSRNLISRSSLMKPLLGRPFLLTNDRNLGSWNWLIKNKRWNRRFQGSFQSKMGFVHLIHMVLLNLSNLLHWRCKLFFCACSVNRSSLAAGLPLLLFVIIFWHFFLTCIVFIYNIALVTLPITFTTF